MEPAALDGAGRATLSGSVLGGIVYQAACKHQKVECLSCPLACLPSSNQIRDVLDWEAALTLSPLLGLRVDS